MEERFSSIIPADSAASLIGAPGVVWVDARGGQDAHERYMAAHIPTAVFVDLETEMSAATKDAAHGGRHPLPAPAAFGAALGRAGITPADHVIIYDDRSAANAAARLWWMLRAAGHERVQVVNGGLAALQKAGAPLTSGDGGRSGGKAYPVKDWNLPLATIDDVELVRRRPDNLVIDVREAYRYRGESEPIDLVAGHIPGAINLPYVDSLDPEGAFHPPGKLQPYFRKALGKVDPANVIVHCGSGVTACHTLLAMDAAGLPLPRLYTGSWSEWSRNDRPVARGDTP